MLDIVLTVNVSRDEFLTKFTHKYEKRVELFASLGIFLRLFLTGAADFTASKMFASLSLITKSQSR